MTERVTVNTPPVGPYVLRSGRPEPLGAQLMSSGCNFSVYCQADTEIWLMLFDHNEVEIQRFRLLDKVGNYHTCFIDGICAGQRYAFLVYQQGRPYYLIDPYAKCLSKAQHWNGEAYQQASTDFIAKSVVVDDSFDWQGVNKPNHQAHNLIIYELHVKGFSWLNPAIPVALRGTYLGLSHPVNLAYFKQLGINAVQIMPILSFMDEPRLADLGLRNYWGYNPVNFFSPEPRYAIADPVTEFKTMVQQFHQAGIEVILDVVFNHTAEGGIGGPILSLKGLAERVYYSVDVDEQQNIVHHHNFTGCGNSVNLDNPWTLKLVIDALRYWVEHMQVDGFRFDLAVTLARENGQFQPLSAFFKVLHQDPVLSQVRLIAEPWDIGPEGYQLGYFPHHWLECNDKFRDNMRAFWRGDGQQLAEFATRLLGSRDLFHKSLRSIETSVNYICYHDGYTLADLVSYDVRHNHANLESNQDGHGHNLSNNHGIEGQTLDSAVNQARAQTQRNLLACLLLAQGTPHFLAGDERGHTQLGNNNAYCQDSAISWIDWQESDESRQLTRFCQQLIALRLRSKLFNRLQLEDDDYYRLASNMQVAWYHPDGRRMQLNHWQSETAQVLILELAYQQEHYLLVFNGSAYEINCHLPAVNQPSWLCVFDTSVNHGLQTPTCKVLSGNIMANAHSVILLQAS
ncbi:glycogen debranching protein GlgX [Motilimonas pumila]|uniref:Glycogen debranching enzyme GlgX n=1 Tax=Motilimonas pumila TaxID=2303987 RepID=A0A418YGB3_9GAMM|nr:glycogen debranching protein GlgX [Motilimonas pumila]RJG48442.1 glycogen debranching enzyme GlgX [Motilimonas pumila]